MRRQAPGLQVVLKGIVKLHSMSQPSTKRFAKPCKSFKASDSSSVGTALRYPALCPMLEILDLELCESGWASTDRVQVICICRM